MTEPELQRIPVHRENAGWIAVDLDGTLAAAIVDPQEVWGVGLPIPRMVERVIAWLAEGKDVRIFTARVGCCGAQGPAADDDEVFVAKQRQIIEEWCLLYLGKILPITATKDFLMIELWDDRCVQVITDTGVSLVEHAIACGVDLTEFAAR